MRFRFNHEIFRANTYCKIARKNHDYNERRVCGYFTMTILSFLYGIELISRGTNA